MHFCNANTYKPENANTLGICSWNCKYLRVECIAVRNEILTSVHQIRFCYRHTRYLLTNKNCGIRHVNRLLCICLRLSIFWEAMLQTSVSYSFWYISSYYLPKIEYPELVSSLHVIYCDNVEKNVNQTTSIAIFQQKTNKNRNQSVVVRIIKKLFR